MEPTTRVRKRRVAPTPSPGSRQKGDCSNVLIWNVPSEVKLNFKIAVARKGKSMTKVLTEFMKDYAQND